MTADTIIQILRIGLSGLAFLLMFLSYRLIAAEQAKDKPRKNILSASRFFLIICVALVVIVPTIEIISRILQPKPSADDLAACQASLEFLQIKSERATDLADLSDAVTSHVRECAAAFAGESSK